jgi:hypothetical protein
MYAELRLGGSDSRRINRHSSDIPDHRNFETPKLDLGVQKENIWILPAPFAESFASAPEDVATASDQAIAACGGDAREAVKALIVANDFLEAQNRLASAGAVDSMFTPVARTASN